MRTKRLKRRFVAMTAMAAVGAVAVAGIAVGSHDVNTSSVAGSKFSPSALPANTFRAGTLFVHTHGNYANPGNQNAGGATDRAELFFDDDGRTNPSATPKCNKNSISSATTTLAQAMAACGSSKVGNGKAQAIYDPPPPGGARNTVNGCVLVFNGNLTPQGQPTSLVFTRIQVGIPPNNTINCATNGTQGNVTVLLEGIIRPNPANVPGTQNDADFSGGRMVDYNHITDHAALPLSDFQVTVKKGNYISARCHDANKRLNIQARFTYNDGHSDNASSSQACTVG